VELSQPTMDGNRQSANKQRYAKFELKIQVEFVL